MKQLTSLCFALALLTALPGCSVGTRPLPRADGTVVVPDGGVRTGDGSIPYDPFDPINACGVSTIPTEQVPGSLLIVFDKSGSMEGEPWARATAAVNNVLTSTNDELGAGLLLFPTGSDSCGVNGSPEVPIAPLTTSRGQIQATLSGNAPGGGTPAFAALRAGYDYLNTLTLPGQRGIVLVSDGGEACERDMADQLFARVTMEREVNDILTFAVGLDYDDNILSTIAYNGGTPRNTTCMPMCTSSGECYDDSECGGTGTCEPLTDVTFPGIPTPGVCTCGSDTDCTGLQTCEEVSDPTMAAICDLSPFPIPGCSPSCQGAVDCCHYNASGAEFQTDFEAALAEIARRLLDSCVFQVPRGTDPDSFNAGLVNVGVTFSGESRTVLRQSSDTTMSTWNYTSGEHDTLIIQGPICERLLEEAAVVEIVLGCPTILI